MWDQHPKKLQDKEWTEETAVMEAGQDLWTMWSLKEWAQEMPYYKFPRQWYQGRGKRKAQEILGRVNMDSGPSNARPAKILNTGSGQPSTKQAKAMVDILGAHATDKDLVDEGLEGDIAVQVQWSTRALVRLAPHGERVEFWEAEGPNLAGDTARDAQRRARVVRRNGKKAAAPATRAVRTSDDNEEGPTAGPSNTTPVLPTLSAEDNKEEVLGEGILGEPKLETRDDGAPVAPEGAEGDGASESANLVWRPTDKPATKFK
ncbi:hypothetical protein C0991_003225 [Blastosporella zonata]|nr:hypothetical protein C0991_003225 [Blastosporella zonata]